MSDNPIYTRELKLWIVLFVMAVLLGVLTFFLFRKSSADRREERVIELIKTNMVIRERLVVLSNEAKQLTAEDEHEKKMLRKIDQLTNTSTKDHISLFMYLQSNQ